MPRDIDNTVGTLYEMTANTTGPADHEHYMRRALALAARGFGDTRPNPMVGAVIVDPDGRIIGEGWHRLCGQGHAEVNAVASVRDADRHLLSVATMYVTLEPCSHQGRTPPCASLIIDRRIPRIVVGAVDPYKRVAGRGIAMLREAGREVVTGVLADESRRLNAMFFTANNGDRRPFVTLKMAVSADGYMDVRREDSQSAFRFSTSLTTVFTHRLRAAHQSILVGSGTVLADTPSLNVRRWTGQQPVPVILDRSGRTSGLHLPEGSVVLESANVADGLSALYERGITSVLVEGGPTVLRAFLESGLWDALRVETSPVVLGGTGTSKAPSLSLTDVFAPIKTLYFDNPAAGGINRIDWYSNNQLLTAENPLCM